MELGIFEGEVKTVIKQFLYVLSGFLGAQIRYFFNIVTDEEILIYTTVKGVNDSSL
ncbi:YtrH family sporulation protein [Peptococcaceae bacterium]|nr:YtrH family sporulation protein [Peptococcaceae bacterium]